MEPIKAQTCISLDTIVQTTINILWGAKCEIERGNEYDAHLNYNAAGVLMSLYSLEYNAVSHDWPITLPDRTRELIKTALDMHTKLHDALADFGSDHS